MDPTGGDGDKPNTILNCQKVSRITSIGFQHFLEKFKLKHSSVYAPKDMLGYAGRAWDLLPKAAKQAHKEMAYAKRKRIQTIIAVTKGKRVKRLRAPKK